MAINKIPININYFKKPKKILYVKKDPIKFPFKIICIILYILELYSYRFNSKLIMAF